MVGIRSALSIGALSIVLLWLLGGITLNSGEFIMRSNVIIQATVLCVLGTQTLPPVLAQGLLTGSVENSSSMPRLIRQEPKYDYDDPDIRQPMRSAASQNTYRAEPRVIYRNQTVLKPVIQKVYVRDERTYWQKHPKVKAATIGAGVGTAAGAVTGLVSGRGVLRGGLIGAGTGAGVGLVRSSHTMKRHPIVRDVASGTLIGLGLSAAATRGRKRMWQGTGVGAAVGLGYGLLKNGLR